MEKEKKELKVLANQLYMYFDNRFNRDWENLPEEVQEEWLEIAGDFYSDTQLNVSEDKEDYLDLLEKAEEVWNAHGICVSNNKLVEKLHLEPAIYELGKVLKRISKRS